MKFRFENETVVTVVRRGSAVVIQMAEPLAGRHHRSTITSRWSIASTRQNLEVVIQLLFRVIKLSVQ